MKLVFAERSVRMTGREARFVVCRPTHAASVARHWLKQCLAAAMFKADNYLNGLRLLLSCYFKWHITMNAIKSCEIPNGNWVS